MGRQISELKGMVGSMSDEIVRLKSTQLMSRPNDEESKAVSLTCCSSVEELSELCAQLEDDAAFEKSVASHDNL